MIEVKSFCGQISIGKQGENLARKVYFDEPELWKETFGEGVCELLHQRSGDSSPYPIKLEAENGRLCWKITASDTAMVGDGKCELRYVVDDVIVKSKIWTTTVLPTLGDNVVEAPEPQKAWVDEVLGAAEEVKSATTHQPIIAENGNWLVWNAETKDYIDSGISAKGEDVDIDVPKVIEINNMYEVPEEEIPKTVPSINLWAKDASGFVIGGGGVVLCNPTYEDSFLNTINGKRMTPIEQDEYGCIYADLEPTFKYTDEKIGDIETALDGIIEIQNGLLGVSE